MSFNVEDLIPHRGRMKLIDEVVEVSGNRGVSSSLVTSQWPCLDNDAVHPIVCIECIAQTAGTAFGWRERQRGGLLEGRVGWLVGVKDARLSAGRIPIGTRLTTTAEIVNSELSYAEIRGFVEADAARIAEATLQVYWPEE